MDDLKIVRLSNSKFSVESGNGLYDIWLSGKNKEYLECSCPGFKFRRKCKHTEAVIDFIKLEDPTKVIKIEKIKEASDYILPYKEQIRERLAGYNK